MPAKGVLNNKEQLKAHYDAVIIGGGIQGAGCAQALVARGFSALLIEKSNVGTATSSRSSKLIHGGLRYLETYQFSLVKKSIAERSTLQNIAPSLVESRKFYLPVYKKQRLKRWQLAVGLFLYSALGGFKAEARFTRVPKAEWGKLGCIQEQGIKQQGLVDVFQYWDGQTDDFLLTQAVIRSAVSMGCDVMEETAFEKASMNSDQQVCVSAIHQEQSFDVSCKVIINAAGPWIDRIQAAIDFAPQGPTVDLVQGSHIEFDAPLGEGIFYVESPDDQRAVFIMPWHGGVLVGTTEKKFQGDPANCEPGDDEIEYLKKTLFHYFPDYKGQYTKAWAGLRVLPSNEPTGEQSAVQNLTRPFSRQARDTILFESDPKQPRAIGLYGGKLTAYRVTAKLVADLAEKTLGPAKIKANTANIPLPSASKAM